MKTLFTQAFPPDLKDYYDSKIAALTFDASNTATGTNEVTINANSGVATFTTPVAASPSVSLYLINNINITQNSIANVMLYSSSDDLYATIVSVYMFDTQISIAINDGGTGISSSPKISFQILNP